MKTIKIGRKEYEIKTGDYILFNRACYQFCAGDGRTLKQVGWSSYSNLIISKSAVKKIDLASLKQVSTGSEEERDLLIRYYF